VHGGKVINFPILNATYKTLIYTKYKTFVQGWGLGFWPHPHTTSAETFSLFSSSVEYNSSRSNPQMGQSLIKTPVIFQGA
jgi:hypothetical protein